MKKGGAEREKKVIKVILITALILVILIVSLQLSNDSSEDISELAKVEIREYEGEKLGSIEDFRENSIKGTQHVDREEYTLKVNGLVEDEKEYTYDEVLEKDKYKKLITLDCVEGWSVTILWEGMLVKDLIEDAHPLEAANTVIFHAADGYTTSFPLTYVIDNPIIMAYKMNDVELPPERGFPFQLVAESKWGYKWIKWITKIELSDDPEYRGFWESRGYSNTGDLDESFRE